MKKLEKFLNLYTLLIINLAIILAAETIGGGGFFYDSGLIYLISLVFVLLAIYRISIGYYTQDEFFKKFLRTSLGVFVLLSLVNIFEYLSDYLSLMDHRTAEIMAVGLYFIGFFVLFVDFESVLTSSQRLSTYYEKEKSKLDSRLSILIVLFIVLLPVLFLKSINILAYAYLILLLLFGVLVIFKAIQLRKIMPVLKMFINYFLLSIIFVIFASLFKFFEIFGSVLTISEIQLTYVAHFFIYFALSFMFLALGKLLNLGGIYQDIKKEIEKGNI